MLDIDLISEPSHAPPPQMYVYKVWESVWPEGQEAIHSYVAGVSGCHIFVPAPHAPPPKGIGQRSKVVILPTTGLDQYMMNNIPRFPPVRAVSARQIPERPLYA